jgi:hypothetical protein
MRTAYRYLLPLLLLGLALAVACRRAPAPVNEVVAVWAAQLPLDPADRAWQRVPEHLAKLLLQDMVEPRLLEPSTPFVRVQAMRNGSEIAFRLTWPDAESDDLPIPGRFVDAAAVQLPAEAAGAVPAPQMGEHDGRVEITFWRADWQATVDGRGHSISDLYPHASIDHYPFQAAPLEGTPEQQEMEQRYSPAQALGNMRAGPRESPVESLIAEGPGTLSPAESNNARGRGVRTRDGWSVVLIRPLPEGLTPRTRTQAAFAVWQGANREVGARKMRTGWVPLLVEEEAR